MTIQPYMRRQARRLTVALLADAATFSAFVLLVHGSVHAERNPLIAAVYASGGVMGVVALKLAAAWLLEARARASRAEVGRWYAGGFALLSSLAIAGTVTGAAFNLASLIDSLRIGS